MYIDIRIPLKQRRRGKIPTSRKGREKWGNWQVVVKGILRLRGCAASRRSHFAQDDKFEGQVEIEGD